MQEDHTISKDHQWCVCTYHCIYGRIVIIISNNARILWELMKGQQPNDKVDFLIFTNSIIEQKNNMCPIKLNIYIGIVYFS